MRIAISDDYAIAYCTSDEDGDYFYYGYEHAICKGCHKTVNDLCNDCDNIDRDWCFVAIIDGVETVIPYPKLGNDDIFDVEENLIRGLVKFYYKEKTADE